MGFTLVNTAEPLLSEAFYGEIIDGLGQVLADSDAKLLVRTVTDTTEELAVYRSWQASRAVDAVVLKDLVIDDPRPFLLDQLGLEFVVLGEVGEHDGYSSVGVDNAQATIDCLDHLVGLGHHRILRVAGPAYLSHVALRTSVILDHAQRVGVDVEVVTGDFSAGSGRRLAGAALTADRPPTAMLFDNDLMALGALDAAGELGVDVPGQLSLLAWDDSVSCQLSRPPLSAVSHDVRELGEQLGLVLLRSLDTGKRTTLAAARSVVVSRGSTAAPPSTH